MIMKGDDLPYHSAGSGHGAASDGRSAVTQSQGIATATHVAPHTISRITIPVESPSSATAQLMRIKTECGGLNGGTVKNLEVAFGSTTVFNASANDGEIDDGDIFFDLCIDPDEIPDSPPDDITLTLELELPGAESSVNIHSVTLGFGESTLEDVG